MLTVWATPQTYVNDADMSFKLRKLFHELNGATPGDMTSARLAAGLRRLDLADQGKKEENNFFYEERKENLETKAHDELLLELSHETHTNGIHLTRLDFDDITEQGALTNAEGALGVAEFEIVMRKQVAAFAQRQVYDTLAQTEPWEDKEVFGERVCLKLILTDVLEMKQSFMELKQKICGSAPAAGAGKVGAAGAGGGGGGEGGTLNRKQRLQELKEWFEEGLIDKDRYLEAQNAIITELKAKA